MRRKLSVFVISALFLAVADMSTASTPIAIGSSCSKLQATSKIHGVDAMCTKLGRAQTWQVNTSSSQDTAPIVYPFSWNSGNSFIERLRQGEK